MIALAGALSACGDEAGPDSRTFTLSIIGSGDGRGTIVSNPAGIDCAVSGSATSGTCEASFVHGTAVTLTAMPTEGTFDGWSGACTGTGPCRLTVDQARKVTAAFADFPVKIEIVPAPGNVGVGSVVSTPQGIDCQISANAAWGACIHSFPVGVGVSLKAAPAPGFEFTGWGGNCGGPCPPVTGQPQIVTAQFTPLLTLGVSLIGTGSGTVTSSPPGISCTATGGTCALSYTYGTVVTLTATPAAGSTFTGWSGACGGTGVCSVMLNQIRNVIATFTAL